MTTTLKTANPAVKAKLNRRFTIRRDDNGNAVLTVAHLLGHFIGDGQARAARRVIALALTHTLDRAQQSLVAQIGAIERKRSWQPSERAMALAGRKLDLEMLRELNDAVQRAYEIRGY